VRKTLLITISLVLLLYPSTLNPDDAAKQRCNPALEITRC